MMSTTVQKPAMTPIPVQLSETECTAFIFPHLSMPKRGPRCKLGYHRVFHLILWVLYTGMQWKCLPIAHGKPAMHYTNVYRAFATWADDGLLWQAFIASVRHLAAEKHLDTSVLHGDGTTTARADRTFAWEDKFKRLLLRFERIQQRHYGMKLLAYTLINLRAFCSA
jgi:transposase